jgi:hypothetical protein
MASDVKLSRRALEAALADFDTYGYGAADLGAGEVAVAAMRALLAVMESARAEEIHESGGRGYRIPPGEIEEYRAGWRDAEARVRRLANWQAEP